MIVFQPISETYEPNVCIIIYSKAMQKPLIATNSNRFESRFVSLMVSNFQVFDVSSEFLFFFFTFYLQVWNRVPGTRRPHTRPDRITDEHVSCRLSIVFCVCVCVCLPLDFVSFVLLLFYFFVVAAVVVRF